MFGHAPGFLTWKSASLCSDDSCTWNPCIERALDICLHVLWPVILTYFSRFSDFDINLTLPWQVLHWLLWNSCQLFAFWDFPSFCFTFCWLFQVILSCIPSDCQTVIFTFPLRVFKWTFTVEMPFIPARTNQFKPHPHTRHLSGPTSTVSNNVACLLMFPWRWTHMLWR